MADSPNYEQSQLAFRYTKCMIDLGAGNKASDVASSGGISFGANFAGRYLNDVMDWVLDEKNTVTEVPAFIQESDRRGRHFHAGNCQEHASVAFMYLYRKEIRQICYFQASKKCGVDHAFIAVGVKNATSNPDDWGSESYVCDPWAGKVYASSRFRDEGYEGKKIVPICQCWLA